MISRIYLDLDETLIHSKVSWGKRIKGRTRVEIKPKDSNNWLQDYAKSLGSSSIEAYDVALRPSAFDIIQRARGIAPVRILTAGTQDYAEAINQALVLGFDSEDIFGREKFCDKFRTAYGGEDYFALSIPDRNAVLIDNQMPTEQFASIKCHALAIPKTQYIQIREFLGRKDPSCFQEELDQIFQEKIPKIEEQMIFSIDK